MALFPDLPPPIARIEPKLTAAAGPLSGPTYAYRGAVINCQAEGHVCRLRMPDHPLHGRGFGSVGTITPLVDLWLDEQQLPIYMRAVPKAR